MNTKTIVWLLLASNVITLIILFIVLSNTAESPTTPLPAETETPAVTSTDSGPTF